MRDGGAGYVSTAGFRPDGRASAREALVLLRVADAGRGVGSLRVPVRAAGAGRGVGSLGVSCVAAGMASLRVPCFAARLGFPAGRSRSRFARAGAGVRAMGWGGGGGTGAAGGAPDCRRSSIPAAFSRRPASSDAAEGVAAGLAPALAREEEGRERPLDFAFPSGAGRFGAVVGVCLREPAE